ncbi:MAG: class I SAM-dependent methyltransferase [Alphaproteobacteria bacterium]|nr:class I SAM-dependent methyltransferase [Alphaproteobacteria bacterium]
MNNVSLASIDNGTTCYPSTKMVYGLYAVKLMQEECEKAGIRSGYEEFFKVIPPRLFEMAAFVLDEASARDEIIASAVREIRANPKAYIEEKERDVSFRKTELELFKRDRLEEYSNADFEVDVSYGRNGLCSHYLGRNLYPYICIQEAIEKGAKQVVIPACGLDATAELLATDYPKVQFYISDLSNVVDERCDLMGKDFSDKFFEGRSPENIHLASVDLSNPQGLIDTLKNEPTFDPEQRTVYAFTGITMYLKPDVVKETIENIANATPDSDIFMGIISHYTKGEAKLTKNVYKNNAILPLYKIYEMAEEISPNVPKGTAVRGMSAANFQRYVDWDQVTQNYLQDHPEINLDAVDINEARTMSQICQGTYHFMPEARKAETWKVYDAYVRASSYQEYMEIEKATKDKKTQLPKHQHDKGYGCHL